jgi:hypothetical protein
MHIKNSGLTSLFFSLAVFFLFAPLTSAKPPANLCTEPNPENSQVFRNFEKVLQTEYLDEKNKLNPGENKYAAFGKKLTRWAMTGHALGRLAIAVQGQPDRRAAFECVQMGLEKQLGRQNFMSPQEWSFFFRILMQAAYGMHNDVLNTFLKGGLPKEPLHSVFKGGIKNPGGSSGGGKVAGANSSKGHCSNWMSMSFSDSKGNLDPVETEKACTLSEKSGDFITRINPVTKACSICSKDDWTPPPPPPPPIRTTGGGVAGGSTSGGGTGLGGGSSGKIKCNVDSGYKFSSEPDAEFNILEATKRDSRGYTKLLYTVVAPSKRFPNRIENVRKEVERILKEGSHGIQYSKVSQRIGKDAFCSFIESQCDMKISSVNRAVKENCEWGK